jgi:prepilin-type N-terminal cleavage/methylation domain-containing protein
MKPAAEQREVGGLGAVAPSHSGCAAADRKPPAVRQRAANGFTLIELLVVIAIIALLLTILTPSLDHAKELARRAVCAAHLRSVTDATLTYALARDGTIPPGVRDIGRPFESYVAYWDNGSAGGEWRYPDGTPKPWSLGVLFDYQLIGNAHVFYCPNQTSGARSYDYPPQPWGSGTGDDYYLRTGHLYIPYCANDGSWAGRERPLDRPNSINEADLSMIIVADDLLSGMMETPGPHKEHYWNVAQLNGSVSGRAGEAYVAGLPWPNQKSGAPQPPDSPWLGHDWLSFAMFRDRLAAGAP